ncbi:hypothetical protein [Hymenobacter weizhouensis]|uniref:hypothetical protein n=1 Tax=Hymenobacter sp. YIM 151500-1 TaxID=2987689 RepID=UPI0022264D4D|nr:hypothetical protein [Hymenobacter sp. YIM 151500-1]UYZ64247.1 hypothetical protein OIS53_05210 [Hymenobacter sp. YIM 151500-1]
MRCRIVVLLSGLGLAGLLACDGSATRTPTASGGAEPPFVSPAAPADPGSPTATPSPSTAPDSLHLLSPDRAGRLRLGMREDEIRAQWPADLLRLGTRTQEGLRNPVLFLTDAQHPEAPPLELELTADPDGSQRLWRIRVTDLHYRTAAGIGVGSPVGAARQQYGLDVVERTEAGLVGMSRAAGMTWMLDDAGLPAAPRPAQVPPATRITGVLLYQ